MGADDEELELAELDDPDDDEEELELSDMDRLFFSGPKHTGSVRVLLTNKTPQT